MNEILIDAANYRSEVYRRAVAHEVSAEYHRKLGVQLGLTSTALSAIVGSAVFVTIVSQLGLDARGTLSIPHEFWPRAFFYSVAGLSILSPVLGVCQAYLNEPAEVKAHTTSSAGYYRVRDRLDTFIRRYEVIDLVGNVREDALKEMDEISKDMEGLRKESKQLTDRAYEKADALISSTRIPRGEA